MSIRKLLLTLSIFYSAISFAQVGVGTIVPNSSTMLDVVASDKGVLLPRVQLNNSTDATTIVPQNEVGLLVYNIAAMADIGVGYHFWDGAKWVAMRTEGLSSGTGDPNGNGTTGVAGDIYVDESTGDIYIHDGNTWVSSNVNETTTTLTDNGNGTFTYTSEDGTATTFDVTQSGTGDPNTNGTTGGAGAVYVDESTGDIYVYNGTTWVSSSPQETLTSITHDAVAGTITYTDENGNNTVLDLNTLVDNAETVTSVVANPTAGTITYIDENGNSTVLDLNTFVTNAETVTTLVDNGDGTYTYTNEDGKTTDIDTVQSGTGDPNTNGTTGNAGDIYVDETRRN